VALANPAKSIGKGFRIGGGIVLAGAGLLFGLWLSARSTDRHGAIFLLGGAVFFALVGASIWTIGYSLSMAARKRGGTTRPAA